MTAEYTYSEARQNLASLLDQAAAEGKVRIRRREGQVFVLQPELSTASPFDVAGVDLGLSAEEIVGFVRASRRTNAPDLIAASPQETPMGDTPIDDIPIDDIPADEMPPVIMLAPRFRGQGEIDLVEKPVPQPGVGQLLLAVKANALCGSERGQFYQGAPVTPGHEAAGVVVAVGPGTSTPIGTPGVVFLMDYCGQCRNCRLGFTNQCLHKRGDMGFNRDGGYGPYELVPESIFFPVDADIPLTDATLLLDIMGTNGHAIRRASLVHPDIQSMLVTGAGPIGLGMLAMAKVHFGQDFPVLIADLVPWRLALAEQLGGRPINLGQTTLVEGMAAHGLPVVDAAMDTSGKTAARQACIGGLDKRGVLVCIGHGEGLSLSVSPDLIATERAVLGSEYFCFDELPANLALLRTHRPYLRQIITHRFGVSDLRAAFDLFFAGETGKVVIEQ